MDCDRYRQKDSVVSLDCLTKIWGLLKISVLTLRPKMFDKKF